MSLPSTPSKFLEQSRYRQRRMMDALRLLPVLGLLLWLFPIFWPTGLNVSNNNDPVSTSSAVIYVFLVWGILILLSSILRWCLRHTLEQETTTDLDDMDVGKTGQ
jgi:ACR3 family arsenite efflux pump ArsB